MEYGFGIVIQQDLDLSIRDFIFMCIQSILILQSVFKNNNKIITAQNNNIYLK